MNTNDYKDNDRLLRRAVEEDRPKKVAMPSDFTARVMARLPEAAKTEAAAKAGNAPKAKAIPLWRWAAAAACVAIVLGIGWQMRHATESQEAEEVVAGIKPEKKTPEKNVAEVKPTETEKEEVAIEAKTAPILPKAVARNRPQPTKPIDDEPSIPAEALERAERMLAEQRAQVQVEEFMQSDEMQQMMQELMQERAYTVAL